MMTVRKPSEEEIKIAKTWDTWSKEPSTFDWSYSDKETCLILAGEAEVLDLNGNTIYFKAGDLVVFEKGLKCVWKITKKIEKHYYFGNAF